MSLHLLRNPIREYDWGSRTAIPQLIGAPCPSPRPQAELWMGAHPRAPSELWLDGRWTALDRCIAADPVRWLGEEVAARAGGELPFLFKVLAAARPLSLQLHPTAEQARAGFAREEARGTPVEAAARSYPDPHAKPELVCALTPFRALCGLRTEAEQRALCEGLGVPGLMQLLADPGDRHRDAGSGLRALLRLEADRRAGLLEEVLRACRARADQEPAYAGVNELESFHPGDPGILAPLLLNPVELAPGEALFLAPGRPHCYLAGTALELMASSDNVLRAGLTSKPVQVEELLGVLDPQAGGATPLRAVAEQPGEHGFAAPTEVFHLSCLTLEREATLLRHPAGPEILLCVEGRVRAVEAGGPREHALTRGQALFVAPGAGYRLRGEGRLYRARCG